MKPWRHPLLPDASSTKLELTCEPGSILITKPASANNEAMSPERGFVVDRKFWKQKQTGTIA
jgi:hypothetical protein